MSYVVTVESMVEISQNFVAFSEYINFNTENFYTYTTHVIVKVSKVFREFTSAKGLGGSHLSCASRVSFKFERLTIFVKSK